MPIERTAFRAVTIRLVLLLPGLLCLGVGIGCRPSVAVHESTSHQDTPPEQVASASDARPQLVAPAASVAFHDVAKASGIDFSFFADAVPGRFFLPEVMGGGLAWLDFDLDGRLDLYVVNGAPLEVDAADQQRIASLSEPRPSDRLFRQTTNRSFVEIASPAGIVEHEFGQAVAVGDYDADGFPDMHLSNYGPNTLLRNNGDGTWSNVTAEAGVAETGWSSSAAWLDLDGDRLLDLYVVNYMDVTPESHRICQYAGKPGYCGPGSFDGVPDRVWRNRGDGTFEPAENELGLVGASGGKGLAVLAADLDDDRQPEIYVANDMEPNFLFAQRGGAGEHSMTYRDAAVEAGCAVASDGMNEASMGVACGDFDGDGRPDLFLTHYYQSKNTLYRNLGGLLFEDHSRRSGIAALGYETLGFGTAAADFDGDGDLDLVMANGHVLGPLQHPSEMSPQLLINDGTSRFSDASALAGPYFSESMLGRGLALADYDDDGNIDVAVSHLDRPLALLRNSSRTNGRFITLSLVGIDRIPPIGGRVTVTAGDRRWTIPITAGGSYLSTSDDRIVVPLPDDGPTVNFTIDWPSGVTTSSEGVAVDSHWQVRESTGSLRSLSSPVQGGPHGK